MNALKPCAFCGGAGHVYEDGRFSIKPYDFPKWYIVCLKCGIRTPTAKMEQVVRIWNRRANDDAVKVERASLEAYKEQLENMPSAQPTLCGYNIEHLILIANVLRKENLPPERVVEALTDIGRIVSIVKDEFEESLRKAVEQCKV